MDYVTLVAQMRINPTVTELLPTMLGDLRPLE